MPIATNVTFLRHSIHDGTVKSIEDSDDGSGWLIQIQDKSCTVPKIYAYINNRMRKIYADYFEKLKVGDPVVYHLDLPYIKHKQENNAYIVIPNEE